MRQTSRHICRDRPKLANLRVNQPATPYVDHPDFRQRNIAAVLFSAGEPLPPLPSVRHLDPDDYRDKPSANMLTRDVERLRFMQFNYARKRAAGADGKALWAQRAMHLREYLMRVNLSLVPYAVWYRRQRVPNLDANEVYGDGMAALLRSVDRFNVSRGFKFSTYAVRAILNQFTVAGIRAKRRAARMKLVELHEGIVDVAHGDHVAELAQGDEAAKLRRVLDANAAGLTPEERLVIGTRYGDRNGVTHRDCAQLLGSTKEGARQIELRALAKLRAVLAA